MDDDGAGQHVGAEDVDHIQVIISAQQSHVNTTVGAETFDIRTLRDDALRFSSASSEQHAIDIVRPYDPLPPVRLDRHKAQLHGSLTVQSAGVGSGASVLLVLPYDAAA